MAAPRETASLLLLQKLQTEWFSTSYTADRSRRNSISLPRWFGDGRVSGFGRRQSQISQCFCRLSRSVSRDEKCSNVCWQTQEKMEGVCVCLVGFSASLTVFCSCSVCRWQSWRSAWLSWRSLLAPDQTSRYPQILTFITNTFSLIFFMLISTSYLLNGD